MFDQIKNLKMKKLNLVLSIFTLITLVSCSNPPETIDETITIITNGGTGGNFSYEDDITIHKLIFEPNGIFKKSTSMSMNGFRGEWTVDEPGKVICKYPDGTILNITVIDDEEFELNKGIYHLSGTRNY